MKLYLKSLLTGLALLLVLPALAGGRGPGGHGGHGGTHFSRGANIGHSTHIGHGTHLGRGTHIGHIGHSTHIGHGVPAWRGHFRNHGHHDINVWRSGVWRHAHHGGRLGWSWVVGGVPYFYAQAVYPYPDPYQASVVVEQSAQVYAQPQAAPQPSEQNWYFCDASQTYYPYVATCEGGWRVVPATPPGAPQ